MEIEDGFIVGVYNYCDRWCERCALTSWCRLFADKAEANATGDRDLQLVLEAPALPQEVKPVPEWMEELFVEQNSVQDRGSPPPLLSRLPEDDAVVERAFSYCLKVHGWLEDFAESSSLSVASPRAVIAWFGSLLPAKIGRAFPTYDLPDDAWSVDRSDQKGSAKVALLGIEQSHLAWLQLVESGLCSSGVALTFIADLVFLGESLERAFPNARGFVRPGLDEPDEVGRL